MTMHARQSLRLIEPITCVTSSYPRPEKQLHTANVSPLPPPRLPARCNCGAPELHALAVPWRLSLYNDGHIDSSQEPHQHRGIASLLHKLHCAWTSPLHNRNVPHSENELNLRRILVNSLDCRNLSLRNTGTRLAEYLHTFSRPGKSTKNSIEKRLHEELEETVEPWLGRKPWNWIVNDLLMTLGPKRC